MNSINLQDKTNNKYSQRPKDRAMPNPKQRQHSIMTKNQAIRLNALKKAIAFYLILSIVFSGCKKSTPTQAQTGNTETSGRKETNQAAADEFFQIAVIPDTQYYTSEEHGGTLDMFQQQITWIKTNRETSNIAYVIHLGDLVDHGEDQPSEWINAKNILYQLETPVTGLPNGIPYGLAVGNHDQTPNGFPGEGGTNNGYAKYFGKDHFLGRAYYGAPYGSSNNNDNHYDLFSANGTDYIVLYIEYNTPGDAEYSAAIEAAVMSWADGVLTTYASRKAIIVSHSLLRLPAGSNSDIQGGSGTNAVAAAFTYQGQVIYDRVKTHDNVFLMLGGHVSGEGFRQDTYNGHVIKSYLSDYQSRQNAPYSGETSRNGGNGLMRLMKFNKTTQTLSVRTFAPRTRANILETDGDSEFSKPL